MAVVVLSASVAFAATTSQQPYGQDNVGPNSQQYHSYDGLICTDCHTLHNSEDGAASAISAAYGNTNGNGHLLYRGDITDMCLSCHKEGQNTSATAALPSVVNSGWVAPIVMTLDGVDKANMSMPAGDFYYSNADPKKGHNPAFTYDVTAMPAAATSLFMAGDPTLGSTPPGNQGSWTEKEWSCHSCHGMHQRFSPTYTAWRQVKRKVNNIVHTGCDQTVGTVDATGYCDAAKVGTTAAGYEAIKSNSRGYIDPATLAYNATRADLNPNEGASLWADESDTNKNVYRGGFSSFCSTCHGNFHGGNGETRTTANANTIAAVSGTKTEWVKHPTNVKMNEANSSYGITTYTKQVSNQQSTSPNPVGYDWKYPLVQPDADFTVAVTAGSAADPLTAIGDDRIMCLTCHKAHASQFENMTRWDTNAHSFIEDGMTDPATGAVWAGGDNPAFGCGKCHQKGGARAFVKSF
ncbi:MAG: hypothetical protein C4526_08865 [Nitrospiraceae bacterium]|nr:MAG: hypothetical protein C4526_08865 [Nitrospiraceae bacterium]